MPLMRASLLLAVSAIVSFAPLSRGAAQTSSCPTPGMGRGGTSRTVQPRIIVIPFTKESEDMRTVLEADINRRIAVTKLKEAFDQEGFSTVDLRGVMNAVKDGAAMTMGSQSDYKTAIIEQSRADIYVEAEVGPEETTGDTKSATVIVTAYLTANGLSLSNKVLTSGRVRGAPFSRLVEAAASSQQVKPFMDMLQSKFDDIHENGVPIAVDISSREGARSTVGGEVGGDNESLGDLLETWFEKNAWKNAYHVSGVSELRMILDEVRIPLRDPKTCNNYNASRFGREITQYLASLKVRAKSTIKGGNIFIELQ